MSLKLPNDRKILRGNRKTFIITAGLTLSCSKLHC